MSKDREYEFWLAFTVYVVIHFTPAFDWSLVSHLYTSVVGAGERLGIPLTSLGM